MIISSIDLMDGKAVQLRQGKTKILERDDIFDLAKKFNIIGEVAVIDLDATMGRGNNEGIIRELCKIIDCRVGGGIRTTDKGDRILSWGAKKIIIGTQATPEFLKNFSPDRVIAAVDAKSNYVVTNGWTKKTSKTPIEKIVELEDYCSEFLYTNVDREGMEQGIDLITIEKLSKSTSNKITYAGGITTINDIEELEKLGCNSQIGMAVYTGKIDLTEALIELLDFEKSKQLIPTIVQDIYGQVLMLAYSSRESLRKAVLTRKGVYFSRSRKTLWEKGQVSGNLQNLTRIRFDCDKDSLLFTVTQKFAACHTNSYSCFEDRKFDLNHLFELLLERKNSEDHGSYTKKLLQDVNQIEKKLQEELQEMVNHTGRDNLVWELADLSYFMMVYMVYNGISVDEVTNELWRRRK